MQPLTRQNVVDITNTLKHHYLACIFQSELRYLFNHVKLALSNLFYFSFLPLRNIKNNTRQNPADLKTAGRGSGFEKVQMYSAVSVV